MDNCLSKELRTDSLTSLLGAWLTPREPLLQIPHPDDLSGLEIMCQLCGAGFAELVSLFEEEMPERFHRIRQAIEASDYLHASRIAHMMSGCCASIGASHLSELCQELEMQMKKARHTNMQDKAEEMLAKIESAYEKIRPSLHTMRSHSHHAQ